MNLIMKQAYLLLLKDSDFNNIRKEIDLYNYYIVQVVMGLFHWIKINGSWSHSHTYRNSWVFCFFIIKRISDILKYSSYLEFNGLFIINKKLTLWIKFDTLPNGLCLILHSSPEFPHLIASVPSWTEYHLCHEKIYTYMYKKTVKEFISWIIQLD